MIRALSLGVLLLANSSVRGQEDQRLINFSVTIVSGSSEKLRPDADPKELLKAIAELEKTSSVASLTRLNFAAMEQQETKFQLGETVPVVSGRMDRGGGPGGGGFGQSVSITRQQVGTVIAALARVVDGGVVAHLEIEQSKHEPRPSPEEGNQLPPTAVTLTFKSAVRISKGETVMLSGFQEKVASDIRRTLILVSANVIDSPKNARDETAQLRVFALQNADAESVRKVITQLFTEGQLNIAADERTNSVIIRAPAEQLSAFEALLLRLDDAKKK